MYAMVLSRSGRCPAVEGAVWVATLMIWSCAVVQRAGATISLPAEQCDAASGCTINNAYKSWDDRSTCKVALVVYPTSEQEIVAAVAKAVQNNQKIKVGTKFGHSVPKLTCPGSDSGVIISTVNYTSIVAIDATAMTITAQGGIQLRALLDAIANNSLSLPHSPYWDGLTLAGLLGTGAHGSSQFGKGSAVHEYVIGMRMVIPATAAEGYAKVVSLNITDEALNATKVSLGVLGVVSTVTLQLEPAFKRNVTLEIVETDVGLEDRILEIAKNVEFGDATWYPSAHRVVYRIDDRVPETTPGEGVNRFYGFQARLGSETALGRSFEDSAEANRDEQSKCQVANISATEQLAVGFGFQSNGQSYGGFPVIGHQHLIQSNGECATNTTAGYYCPWDPQIKGLFYFDSSAWVPMRSLKAFLTDVKALRDLDPSSFCGLDFYTGLLIRFVKASSGAYMGAQEDVAAIDMTYYRAYDGTTPRLNQDVYDELEQIAFFKYGAKPHWGKNRNYAFDGVAQNLTGIAKFLAVKDQFDPQGFFSGEWTDALLGVAKPGAPAVTTIQPYCALEGLCVCSEDVHCAPEKNYFCRPGKVFAGARVCRFEDQAPSPALSPSSGPALSAPSPTTVAHPPTSGASPLVAAVTPILLFSVLALGAAGIFP